MADSKISGGGANARDKNQPRRSANTKRDIDIDLGPKRGIQPREAGLKGDPRDRDEDV